ncbi:dentin sialophosphoprotein-like [Senna tora]|uniref:Dentin sialophosphoprotein-like n=1 Tax=Senna tora TaxID=362788 RepID=A0A835CGH1_9FABA|nr:dentin sialophosphoprotein-like [Senna tora]
MSILGEKAFLWEIVLESGIVLAIIIDQVVLPDPFEPPSLQGRECAKTILVPPICRVRCPTKPGVTLPDTGIEIEVSEGSYKGRLSPINFVMATSCCPAISIPQCHFHTHWLPSWVCHSLICVVPVHSYGFKLLVRPSDEVFTWEGDQMTKKSLLKSPVETTDASETPFKKLNQTTPTLMIKHSHDKKKEFDENDAKASVRMQNADHIPKLGRKDLQPYKDDKEKELINEKETENNEDEEKDGLVEDQDTHEAREVNYKADDASSAVTHDTQTASTEGEILSSENSDANTEMSVVNQENNPNFTEESLANQNDSDKITKDELKDVNALNTTADQESGNTTLSYSSDSSNTNTTTKAKPDSYLEASNNHTITEASNNSTGDGVNSSGSSEQDKMVMLPESKHSQNTTVDKTETRDVKNENTEKLEQSNPVRDDNLLNTNSTDSVKTENGDAATGESSNSGADELVNIRNVTSNETKNDSRNSNTKENFDASMDEKFKNNTEIVETNGTQNSSYVKLNTVIDASVDEKSKGNTETSEINGTQNISDAKEHNDVTNEEKPKEDAQTDETSDSSSGNETSDAAEQDAIDASDNHIHKDVTEVRTDLDTLPDIRIEGNIGDGDETAAE